MTKSQRKNWCKQIKVIKNKKIYSYQDCWDYLSTFLQKKENLHFNLNLTKNSLISLCQVTPKEFWLNFHNKLLSSSSYKKICCQLNKHLEKNIPIQYLTKEVYFYNSLFKIKKGVFIPQGDTEILLEKTLELINKYWKEKKSLKILDIGTGCGNLAISLAKINPNWKITAVDINQKALRETKINTKLHRIKNVKICHSNLFNNLDKRIKYNVIIANPPYVSKEEYAELPLFTKKQPRRALLARDNGYWFYQKIFQTVSFFLTKKFLIACEIGHQQKEKIVKIINKYFRQGKVKVFLDKRGKERVIAFYKI